MNKIEQDIDNIITMIDLPRRIEILRYMTCGQAGPIYMGRFAPCFVSRKAVAPNGYISCRTRLAVARFEKHVPYLVNLVHLV
jgi:hypothetical protein